MKQLDSTILLEEVASCKLWEGSGLQLDHKYRLLTLEKIQTKIDAFKRCDDLTRDEKIILAAYERVVKRHG